MEATMNPRILEAGELFFWIRSEDAAQEPRASVYVGKGAESNADAAKFWLEPEVEIARTGQTLTLDDLRLAWQTIAVHREEFVAVWRGYRTG
jgi:hypothetical protein